MASYLVVEIEVLDSGAYDEYVARIPPVVQQYGGRYLVRGGRVTALAGGWRPERMIIVEFASDADLFAFVTSPEYGSLAPLRERSTVTRSVALEGAREADR
jgi:uncharacterized protein (DUF1330 family)